MSNSSQDGIDLPEDISVIWGREGVDLSSSRDRVEHLREKFVNHDCRAENCSLDLELKHIERQETEVNATMLGRCKQCDWVDFAFLSGQIQVEVVLAGDPTHGEQ